MRADARGRVAGLLLRQGIAAAAAAAAQRGERLELRQRGLRIDHAVVDRAAAVAVHLEDRRHLEARARGQRADEQEGGEGGAHGVTGVRVEV